MLYILSNGFNRKRTEDHKGQYKHENSISKHLLLKKKKLQGDESTCKLQERKQASERETTHFSIPRSGQQSHRAPI